MRLVVPPMRMIRWPFSAGWTALMVVVPVFWPILGVVLVAEVFCLALWAASFLVANLLVSVVFLATSLIHAGVARGHDSA